MTGSARSGENHALGIRVVPYSQFKQRPCADESGKGGPPSGSCRTVLGKIPATYNHQVFRQRGLPGVEEVLPRGSYTVTAR